MTNWTIVDVKTERVAALPAPTVRRLTKRGRVVVAALYAVGAILVGMFLADCLLDGLEAEGRMRDAQNAPYVQAMQAKETHAHAYQALHE